MSDENRSEPKPTIVILDDSSPEELDVSHDEENNPALAVIPENELKKMVTSLAAIFTDACPAYLRKACEHWMQFKTNNTLEMVIDHILNGKQEDYLSIFC